MPNKDWKTKAHREVAEGIREVPEHGASGYSNYGCRCDICTKAWTDPCFKLQVNQTRECELDFCDEKLYAKGLCKAHYERQRRGAEINIPIIPARGEYAKGNRRK